MDTQDPKPEAERALAPPPLKQIYTPPVLRVEGNIEKLTQALAPGAADLPLGAGGSAIG